jgi:hypothetical protein
MRPHEDRVVEEQQQLDTKIEALEKFIQSPAPGHFPALDGAEQRRLRAQLTAMRTYSDILGERIAAFPPYVEPKSGTVELDRLGTDKSQW